MDVDNMKSIEAAEDNKKWTIWRVWRRHDKRGGERGH
jgi:hypothetical protein